MAARQDSAAKPTDAETADKTGVIRRFLRLAGPFFWSEGTWTVRLLAIGVIALTLFQLGVQIRINLWNRDFFNALEQRDWNAFTGVMLFFIVLAGISMCVAVYQIYLKQLLQLRWRRWLTAKMVAKWLENSRHYQLGFVGAGVDNPDQRLTENVQRATEQAVDFALGLIEATLTLAAFSTILWTLSGSLPVNLGGLSFDIPGYMVWAALLYAGAGSVATYLVGQPIVKAYAQQNMIEADYRYALVRLRENSEGVALIRGESDEQKGLHNFFRRVYVATTHLMRTQRHLMWLTSAYGLISMVYPTLVASPRYFSGEITLGGLMQITLAFGQVQVGLNWFLDNFPRIAEWR